MRISDWSSDVCSSDLDAMAVHAEPALHVEREFELAEFIAIGGDDQRALGAIADGDAGRGLDLGGELRPHPLAQAVERVELLLARLHLRAGRAPAGGGPGGAARSEERRGGQEGGGT